MKRLKNYFKMIITAVICFAVSIVSGKKKGQASQKITGKNIWESFYGILQEKKHQNTGCAFMETQSNENSLTKKEALLWKHFVKTPIIRYVSGRVVGPGDRIPLVRPG